jgi:hypothetical protein
LNAEAQANAMVDDNIPTADADDEGGGAVGVVAGVQVELGSTTGSGTLMIRSAL